MAAAALRPAQYSTSGKLSARDIDDEATGLQLRNASLSANFQANNTGIKLNDIAGHLLGGVVTGKAETSNGAPGRGRPNSRLPAYRWPRLPGCYPRRAMPLEKLKPAGGLDGGLES